MKFRKLTKYKQKQYQRSKKIFVVNENFDNGIGSAVCNPTGVTWIGDITMGWQAGRQASVVATAEYTDERTFSGNGKSIKINITEITATGSRGAEVSMANNTPQSSWKVAGDNNRITVESNTNYIANVKTLKTSGAGGVTIAGAMFDASGNQLGAASTISTTVLNVWQDVTLVIPKISNAVYLSVRLRINGVIGETPVAFFDDFNLFSDN